MLVSASYKLHFINALSEAISVIMIIFCLYSDIMSDHAKFDLTFTKFVQTPICTLFMVTVY